MTNPTTILLSLLPSCPTSIIPMATPFLLSVMASICQAVIYFGPGNMYFIGQQSENICRACRRPTARRLHDEVLERRGGGVSAAAQPSPTPLPHHRVHQNTTGPASCLLHRVRTAARLVARRRNKCCRPFRRRTSCFRCPLPIHIHLVRGRCGAGSTRCEACAQLFATTAVWCAG